MNRTSVRPTQRKPPLPQVLVLTPLPRWESLSPARRHELAIALAMLIVKQWPPQAQTQREVAHE